MSFVTYAELLKGAERSSRKPEVLRRLTDLTRSIHVRCAAHASLCKHCAAQFARPRTEGTPIGGNELWIVCHALADDCTLVSNNLGESERVSWLSLENWVR